MGRTALADRLPFLTARAEVFAWASGAAYTAAIVAEPLIAPSFIGSMAEGQSRADVLSGWFVIQLGLRLPALGLGIAAMRGARPPASRSAGAYVWTLFLAISAVLGTAWIGLWPFSWEAPGSVLARDVLALGPSGYSALFMVAVLGIFVDPFVEEVFCRGAIMQSTARWSRSLVAAAVASATIFALGHLWYFDIWGMGAAGTAALVTLGIFGMVLAFVATSSFGLWGAIVLHGIRNALELLVLAWMLRSRLQ